MALRHQFEERRELGAASDMGQRQAGAPRIALPTISVAVPTSASGAIGQADGVDVLDGDFREAVAVEADGGSP